MLSLIEEELIRNKFGADELNINKISHIKTDYPIIYMKVTDNY